MGPSKHLKTSHNISKHPHNTLTTPSQHLHNPLTTPSQRPHNTLTTPSQHPHNTLKHTHKTPSQHPHNTLTTPTQHHHNISQHLTPPSQHPHNTLTTSHNISLAAAGKNMMCQFYQEHFPEGPHKISPEDLKKVAEILEKAFSDDVLNPVFLPMIEEEDKKPTFPHPDNWDDLTLKEKGDIMVIVLQIKIICVADFSSHYFKEISSLSKLVEELLNKDTHHTPHT